MHKRDGFRYLTAKHRNHIRALDRHEHSHSAVACSLGVSEGTISRERARDPKRSSRYSAIEAQKEAEDKRARHKRPGIKIVSNPDLTRFIIRKPKQLWSPDEIAGRMKRDGIVRRIGTSAIEIWLNSKKGKPFRRYRRVRRPKRKPSRSQKKI